MSINVGYRGMTPAQAADLHRYKQLQLRKNPPKRDLAELRLRQLQRRGRRR